jgi:hypothetical protein
MSMRGRQTSDLLSRYSMVSGGVRCEIRALRVLRRCRKLEGLRHCENLAVIDAHAAGQTQAVMVLRIGPELVFGRLWKESGIQKVIQSLLQARRYEFDVERAIYLTVLHRLFASGSDRAAERWL